LSKASLSERDVAFHEFKSNILLALSCWLSDGDKNAAGEVALRSKALWTVAVGLALLGCAGRDPAPIASVQAQDVYADCTMIRAEIEANNAKAKELSDEQGWKVAQNVSTGLVGLVIWPVWFGMDWKGAAAKDAAALQARQQYLTTLAEQRCAPGYRPPPPPSGPYVPQAYSPPPRQ
jgi:hypothetical protein